MSSVDVTIREATVADAAGITRVHIESSRDAYAPLAANWPEPNLQRSTALWIERLAPDADRVQWVAAVDGDVVGFLGGGPARVDGRGDVEVYVIHVDPAHRGRGIGGRLWAHATPRLRDGTRRSLYLENFAELRSRHFYAARGGRIVSSEAGTYHGGPVTEVTFVWPAGVSSALRPYRLRDATADDFELLFGLKRAGYRDHVVATYGAWDEAWQRERFTTKFDPKSVQVIVVDGRDVGALCVDEAADPVYLASIELAVEARGQGVGTAVIGDVIAQARARERGVQLQVFRVSPDAQRLYERLGFTIADTNDTHITMRCR